MKIKMRLYENSNMLMLIVLLCFFSIGNIVNGRICGGIDVRNSPEEFETQLRNCTVVVGSVTIVGIEPQADFNFSIISFPELR